MQKETKEIIGEITQDMINVNNKYYEERKIAKQEIRQAIDNINHRLYYCDDSVLKRLIREQLDIIKDNTYRV